MSNQDELLIQPEPAPMRPLALRYGLLTALALFVVGLILQFSGLVDAATRKGTGLSSVITLAILFGGIFIALGEYKKESGNSLTFGKALGFGTWTSLVIALAGALLYLLQVTLIDPGMIETIREMAELQFEEQGLSGSDLEQAMSIMKITTGPVVLTISAAIFQFIMAFIMALIAAAIKQNAKSTGN